jgi:hypothetical protein
MRQVVPSRLRTDNRARYGDVAIYLVFTVFALATLAVAPFFDYRVWAAISLPAYLFGLVQSAACVAAGPAAEDRWLSSRRAPIAVIAVLGIVVPLVVLVITRLRRSPWSEQPEVWVVERSTQLLLHHGTPYTDLATLGRPAMVNDYTPYGPVMTVFGLPRALFGVSALTDARVAFVVLAVAAVATALWLTGPRRLPVRALQLVVACPMTALTVAVSGDDVVIVALLLLALALLYRARPALCAAVLTVAVSMKLTAVPALIVLAIAVLAMLGGRAFGRFVVTVAGLGVALNLPVLLVDPGSFVEHVIRFPIGLGKAHSPAASPLPGNLIARLGPAGHDVSLALLAAAGLAMAIWLVTRPPRTSAGAAVRIAVGLTGALLLAPATRYGYLIYPIVLFGAAIALRQLDQLPVEIQLETAERAPALN